MARRRSFPASSLRRRGQGNWSPGSGRAVETADGLHEHDRRDVPTFQPGVHFAGRAVFPQAGGIGARAGRRRTPRGAVRGGAREACSRHPAGNVAVVSHGTVIALLLARHGGGRALELWREMGLPSYAVLTVPGYRVEEKVSSAG